MIAQRNDYLNEAYKQLDLISQDAEKRLEYTARQKAIYDYNTIMAERFDDGMELGIEEGKALIIAKMRKSGMSDDEIQRILNA